MNKIHENMYYSEAFYHISISTQMSRWLNLSRKQNYTGLLKNVKTNNEFTVHF
jgi:hypothetical protein